MKFNWFSNEIITNFPLTGHVQYLSNLVRENRNSFRKKYGSQYMLDVIKQHYNNGEQSEMSLEDRKTMRQALLDILKTYINKDLTANDMASMLGFLCSVRDNEMITEMVDVLLTYIDSRHCKDQFYLLVLEPRCAEILYALLLEQIFTAELRAKLLKVTHWRYFWLFLNWLIHLPTPLQLIIFFEFEFFEFFLKFWNFWNFFIFFSFFFL